MVPKAFRSKNGFGDPSGIKLYICKKSLTTSKISELSEAECSSPKIDNYNKNGTNTKIDMIGNAINSA